MGWKLGTVLVGVAAGLAVGGGVAFAHDEYDADGGHCEYNGVINAMNSCDTNNGGGGGSLRDLEPTLRDLPPANENLDDLRPVTDDLRPTG